MEIMAVTENEWEELKAIRLESLKESPEAFCASYETALRFTEDQWKSRASGSEGCNFFIAKISENLVGIVGGFYKTGEYELISLWVSPANRKHGIAKQLIGRVFEHAKGLSYSYVFLEVKSSNLTACRLYEHCGFCLVSTQDSSESEIPVILKKYQFNIKA